MFLKNRRLFWLPLSILLFAASLSCAGGDSSGDIGTAEKPYIVSTLPTAGAGNVPIETVIKVYFSKDMDGTSIDTNSFRVNDGTLPGAVSYDAEARSAVFTPDSSLDFLTVYNVTLTSEVRDLNGNNLEAPGEWSFTTRSETGPLEISSVLPMDGASAAPVDSNIIVTFSETIDDSTINSSTFIVTDEFGNTLSGAYSYDDSTNAAVFNPAIDLIGNISYVITITTGIKSTGGNSLAAGEEFQFSTASSSVDWVFMIYLAADNSLSLDAAVDLYEMAQSGLNGRKVRVIVLIDQAGSNNTYIYEVINGTLKQLTCSALGLSSDAPGEVDTGNPDTLDAFIQFVQSNYPADNYSLVLWSHGGGWRSITPFKFFIPIPVSGKKIEDNAFKDISYDDTSGSEIGNNALQGVLAGKGISLLAMDACLMGMVETAYEMRKSVTGIDYLVFSQNSVPSSGFQYTNIINHFIEASDITPGNFASIIVNDYADYYGENSPVTLSSINLGLIDQVVADINTFTTYIDGLSMTDVDNARANCQYYDFPWYVDLYGFVDNFSGPAAAALKSSIENAVSLNRNGNMKPGSNGLSINFTTVYHHPDYADGASNIFEIDFLEDSSWDDYLNSHTFGYTIDLQEPDDNSFNLFTVPYGYAGESYIIDPQEADIYTLNVQVAGSIIVDLTSVPSNCDLDIYLYSIDNLNSPVAYSFSGLEGDSEWLEYPSAEAGKTYYLEVVPYNDNSPALNLMDSYSISFGGSADY